MGMTPTMEPLRPLGLGEILDRTAQLYRRNFLLFAGVAAVPVGVIIGAFVVIGVIGGIAGVAVSMGSGRIGGTPNPALLLILIPLFLALMVALIVAAAFSHAGMSRAAISANLGRPLTIREALKGVWPQIGRYVGLLLLQGLLVGGIPFAIAGVIFAVLVGIAALAGGGTAASAGAGVLTFLLFVAAFVVVVWMAMGYSMGMAVSVAEDMPAWDSLSRAWQLSKGTRGRIFLMFLLVWALTTVISLIAYTPVFIALAIAGAAGNGAQYAAVTVVVAEILNLLINFALQTLVTPVYTTALVLFYYDQRIRKEGFDIEWMMGQAGLAEVKVLTGQGDASGAEAGADSVKER